MSEPYLILHKELESLKKRLLAKTTIIPDSCWICIAGGANSRYGTIWYEGSNISCHRASWMVHKGPIPNGLHVLHTCDNMGCVNPDHLFLGTETDNMRDKHAKGRHDDRHGIFNPRAKLDVEQVLEIRKLISNGANQRIVAERFGVAQPAVSNIHRRKTWSHIP